MRSQAGIREDSGRPGRANTVLASSFLCNGAQWMALW
jgi:hypothetical protein